MSPILSPIPRYRDLSSIEKAVFRAAEAAEIAKKASITPARPVVGPRS